MLNSIKIWWFQFRYGLESGADESRGMNGAVGGAQIRGVEWKDAKPVTGHFGRTVTEARLNALRFWIRQNGHSKSVNLDSVGNAAHVFKNAGFEFRAGSISYGKSAQHQRNILK